MNAATSMSPTPAPAQPWGSAEALDRVAEAIYQSDRRTPDAKLSELDATSRALYLEAAAAAVRSVDPVHHRAALYVAIDAAGHGWDLPSLTPLGRRGLVEHYDRLLVAYRRAIAGGMPAESDTLGPLAAYDAQILAEGGR